MKTSAYFAAACGLLMAILGGLASTGISKPGMSPENAELVPFVAAGMVGTGVCLFLVAGFVLAKPRKKNG